MINKKEVVPPKHKPPTDGPESKNRLKRKLQTVEAELAIKMYGHFGRKELIMKKLSLILVSLLMSVCLFGCATNDAAVPENVQTIDVRDRSKATILLPVQSVKKRIQLN